MHLARLLSQSLQPRSDTYRPKTGQVEMRRIRMSDWLPLTIAPPIAVWPNGVR
jgi:hypothetical protein